MINKQKEEEEKEFISIEKETAQKDKLEMTKENSYSKSIKPLTSSGTKSGISQTQSTGKLKKVGVKKKKPATQSSFGKPKIKNKVKKVDKV